MKSKRLEYAFFHRPCLDVAKDLVGKVLVHKTPEGILRLRISETEAYCGEDDTACHAHKGRTKRTEVMYGKAGNAYVYLCYGMHWLLNIVTGKENEPEAVLVRACVDAEGPGKLTKRLQITGQLNAKPVYGNTELLIEDDGFACKIKTDKRVGIGYASREDQDRPWRFVMVKE